MNKLEGHIEAVEVSGSISMVTVRISKSVFLKSIIIETPQTVAYLKKGHFIKVLFKETEVIIGSDPNPFISLENRIEGTIKGIVRGTLISKVSIKTKVGEIESIISTQAMSELKLKENSKVLAMVKSNEIMLSK